MKEYEIEIAGLADAVARCAPAPGHRALIDLLRRIDGLEGLELATTRGEDGGTALVQRKVLTAGGVIVHDDHRVWMAQQLQADAGDAAATYKRLRLERFRLSQCKLVSLYFVVDRRTDDAADFLQVEVAMEDECLDCEVLQEWPYQTPRDLDDLLHFIEGSELPEDQRARVRAPTYRLHQLVDVGRFSQLAQAIERRQLAGHAKRRYTVKDDWTGESSEVTYAELDPGFDRYPSKARRLFDDWQASSAGRSGARMCANWVMKISDWTDPKDQHRYLSLVPMWTFDKKLAEVDASKGDVYALFSKLQTLDRRVKVPFGWYFYLLHGNRVHDGSGRRILKAAEDGLIVLPECDYQVLRAWRERPYGY